MKESVFQEKMSNLKKKKELLNDSVKKHKAKVSKLETEIEEVDKQILILNHKYSALSLKKWLKHWLFIKNKRKKRKIS